MVDKPTAGLRKRQQISQANRMMLLWIAGVSIIVGVSIVLVVFLAQKIWFGEKVIGEKNKTVAVLEDNLKAIEGTDDKSGLRDNIQERNTDQNLMSVRLNESDPPLQSILDALPANANSTALASSLQIKLLSGIPGVTIETITVDPADSDGGTDSDQIGFAFSVSTDNSNYAALKQVLERLEKSIRPFNVTSLNIEGQGSKVIMSVSGVSYYSSAKTVQLETKVIRQ